MYTNILMMKNPNFLIAQLFKQSRSLSYSLLWLKRCTRVHSEYSSKSQIASFKFAVARNTSDTIFSLSSSRDGTATVILGYASKLCSPITKGYWASLQHGLHTWTSVFKKQKENNEECLCNHVCLPNKTLYMSMILIYGNNGKHLADRDW